MRVASFLRAHHAPIEFEFPHSGLTINLHGEVLESDLLLQTRLAYTIAYASLHANPAADLNKAMDRTNELHKNAFYSVPYFGKMIAGDDGSGTGVTQDMKDMAKRYRDVFGKKDDKKNSK